MGSNQQTLGISERFVAGSLAGVFAQSVIYPMEVSRSLLISAQLLTLGCKDALKY